MWAAPGDLGSHSIHKAGFYTGSPCTDIIVDMGEERSSGGFYIESKYGGSDHIEPTSWR